MNVQTCSRLPSKKNDVYLKQEMKQDMVVKIFSARSRFHTEKEIGDLLRNSRLLVPERLEVDEEKLTIVYRYIEGTPLVDLLESLDIDLGQVIITGICCWLADFYSLVKEKTGQQYILGDIHMRNFIYAEGSGEIYGVDFEECRPGRIETDAARLWVFILNYDPPFTRRKIALANMFKNTLFGLIQLDEAFFIQEVERETAELTNRRAGRKIVGEIAKQDRSYAANEEK